MAERRIGIIMNGVTGRMGIQPAPGPLDRRDPRPGRRDAREWRHASCRPDHRRAQRGEAGGAGRRRTASRASATDLDACLADPKDEIFFDAAHHADARRPAVARRSTPASTSIARSRSPTTWPIALALAKLAKAAGIKHGVVQDKLFLPGPAQAEDADRQRLLRPHLLGARRVRLLGVRGRPAAARSARPGTTARPRAAASSSICSATGATCSTTCSARSRRSPASAPTHIPERIDEDGKPYDGRRRRRGLRHLPARRRRDRAHQLLLGDARAARRPGDLPGRRHAWLGRRRPARSAGRSRASTRRSRSGTPTSRRPSTSSPAGRKCRHTQDYHNGFSVQWEVFLRHVAGETRRLSAGT